MKLRALRDDHDQTTLDIPFIDYEYRQDWPNANTWRVVHDEIIIDTQLITTMQLLWKNGYMTVGCCIGHYPEEKGCDGYIAFVGMPVPEGMFPLGRPQKTIPEIVAFCKEVQQLAEVYIKHTPGHNQSVFLCWKREKLQEVVAAIAKILH